MTHRVVGKLQALVRIPTVSYPDWDDVDVAAFDRFLEELAVQFPRLHEQLELTRVDTHGLLFRWPGLAAERPVVLMAHLDVVPVDGDAVWQHPPFAAEIHDGAIWGRGTLDDKGDLVAICEAVETLLEQDFAPAQDVWLSFGCNEEVFGAAAQAAVEELSRRGVRPWFVLDEGGAVAAEAFPGIAAPIGVVGVGEKGVTSLELRVEGRGGHASTPERNGPTVRLARALRRLDRRQMPASLPAPTLELFRRLAPHAPAALRPVLANAGRLDAAADPGAARGRPGDRGDDPHDVRDDHALGIAGDQRRREHRQGRGEHPDHGRRHRRRGARARAHGDRRRSGAGARRRAQRAHSALAPGRRLRAHRGDDHRAVPRRDRGAVRDDGGHRRAALHRASATGCTASRRSG